MCNIIIMFLLKDTLDIIDNFLDPIAQMPDEPEEDKGGKKYEI